MKKHLISFAILIVYILVLIKVMVFKDVPMITFGVLKLSFGGINPGQTANFIPLTTIIPYLLGSKGLLIGGINLVGNIILLIPIGYLVPFIYQNISRRKILLIALGSGLFIETMQVVLKVGIFDIDDVILNALGVMIGYWSFLLVLKWMREKKYVYIILSLLLIALISASILYAMHPKNNPVANEFVGEQKDLCGGTGGIGEVISVGENNFILTRRDGSSLLVNLNENASIKTPKGDGTIKDLALGNRVTVVGDAHTDGTFSADVVLVCGTVE